MGTDEQEPTGSKVLGGTGRESLHSWGNELMTSEGSPSRPEGVRVRRTLKHHHRTTKGQSGRRRRPSVGPRGCDENVEKGAGKDDLRGREGPERERKGRSGAKASQGASEGQWGRVGVPNLGLGPKATRLKSGRHRGVPDLCTFLFQVVSAFWI